MMGLGLMSVGSSPSGSGLETLTALLALVTQPEEAREYLSEIAKASLDLDQKKTETENAVKALNAEYNELRIRMAREADEHARKLASDRYNCERQCALSMDEVRKKQEDAESLRQQTAANNQRANELKNRWEAKMRKMAESEEI
jgi:hypothetical protein